MREKIFKHKRKHSSYHKQIHKKQTNNCSQQFNKCRRCVYFPRDIVISAPYVLDEHGVKHRDIQYLCLYDLHEITSGINVCPRGVL